MGVRKHGFWIERIDGLKLRPFDDREFSIDDIATSLAKECRFNGRCRGFYSVAEHSVYVSRAVPPEHALAGLLHDSVEAMGFGDITSPCKDQFPVLKQAESLVLANILTAFGLAPVLPTCVHDADFAILVDEREQLLVVSDNDWILPERGLGITIHGWPWQVAKMRFLARFDELVGKDAI